MSRAVAFAYRRAIRPLLPLAEPVRYAGVPTALTRTWGDASIPATWYPPHLQDVPDYEAGLVRGLNEHVKPGDRVVVVGGGIGVTAAIAALEVGPSGHVDCFEGASEGVEKVRETARRNGVADRLDVHHAVVARSISVYGTEPEHAVVEPRDLPDCDVLELDCEGAEVDIIQGITLRPRVLLVETHGIYGAPTERVTAMMEAIGYTVTGYGIAEPRLRALCEQHDIRVVVGVRAERSS